MDKVELTADEREELKRIVKQAKTYRNRKLKEVTFITIGVLTLGIGISYWTGNLSWTIFLVTLSLGLLLTVVFLFVWYLAGLPINKMEKDLALEKRTGISQIKTINVFNRTIRLADGTTVYEGDSFYGKWTKGDKIYYRTTNSGEHLFECKRVE